MISEENQKSVIYKYKLTVILLSMQNNLFTEIMAQYPIQIKL